MALHLPRFDNLVDNYFYFHHFHKPRFHKLFLGIIKRFGRMHEAGLMGIYTVWTQKLAVDVGTVMKMLVKGKAPLIPSIVKENDAIRKIYERAEAAGKEGR